MKLNSADGQGQYVQFVFIRKNRYQCICNINMLYNLQPVRSELTLGVQWNSNYKLFTESFIEKHSF